MRNHIKLADIYCRLSDEEKKHIVIVQSMLLTGFDAPPLSVLYIDKPMKEHTLLQAIARVNRIAAGKDFGLIVDYWGLFGNLNNAMEMYSDDRSGLSGYDPADIADSIATAAEGQEKLKQAHKELCDEFGVELPIDKMDILIENTIKTAMSRY